MPQEPAEQWGRLKKGRREECAAVGCPEMLANAGSAAASLGENGNIRKPWYSGWFFRGVFHFLLWSCVL